MGGYAQWCVLFALLWINAMTDNFVLFAGSATYDSIYVRGKYITLHIITVLGLETVSCIAKMNTAINTCSFDLSY